MRINRTDNAFKIYNNNSKVEKDEKLKSKKTDQVNLSEEALDYQFAMKKVKEMSDIRQEKVDDIKAQLEAGTYKVDSGKIADKILKNVELHKKYNSW